VKIQLPEAAFFDLDDTILAYEAISQKCWGEVCLRFAPLIGGLAVDDLLASIDEVRAWYWSDPERDRRGRLNLRIARQEIVSGAFARLGVAAQSVANEIADSYTTIKEKVVELVPGAMETLRSLRDNGNRLALITNGSAQFQRAKVNRFGLEPLFDYILIEGDFGVGKPDQRVYRHVLKQLNVLPSQASMVGDNLQLDVADAQLLGIHGVWVDWEGSGLPENSSVKPDHIVRTISELVR
jgi:putative hydrolase of the HAD superfamily